MSDTDTDWPGRGDLDVRQILADIDLKLSQNRRLTQETRYAPFVATISGMTAGGALFATGATFWRLFH